jgi:hypothetical protein
MLQGDGQGDLGKVKRFVWDDRTSTKFRLRWSAVGDLAGSWGNEENWKMNHVHLRDVGNVVNGIRLGQELTLLGDRRQARDGEQEDENRRFGEDMVVGTVPRHSIHHRERELRCEVSLFF